MCSTTLLGVRYIGGCCGFEPYHLRAVAEELEPERGEKYMPWLVLHPDPDDHDAGLSTDPLSPRRPVLLSLDVLPGQLGRDQGRLHPGAAEGGHQGRVHRAGGRHFPICTSYN